MRIPHPAYPLMHVGLQVPQLGLHFSAGRYERLLQLIATFDGSKDQIEKAQSSALWYPADHEDVVRVLFWKVNNFIAWLIDVYVCKQHLYLLDQLLQGIGNAVAEWQPRCVVLSGSYLYVLESVNSQAYQRCFRFQTLLHYNDDSLFQYNILFNILSCSLFLLSSESGIYVHFLGLHFSLDGKQVLEVPPSNIGGSSYVLAVCSRGIELQKVLNILFYYL